MEKRNFKNKKKGYTLVEVITVLAVIAIVAGAAVYGIIAYQRYAAFRRNNEYAKTIFTAAQSALTHYKASGQLETLEEKLDKNLTKTDNTIEIVPEGVAGDYTGRLYSLTIQGGDKESDGGKHLAELLEAYIMDEKIWDASICLEFDPLDGTVYSVCYSDKADAFTYYGEPGKVSGGVMDITDRTEKTRKEICLGYYSADLSDRSPSAYGKPSIAKVELVNGETLDLKWWMSLKYKSITKKLTYTVRLYDEDNKLCLAFSIKGSDLKNAGSGDETISTKVYTYTGTGVNLVENELGDFRFRAYSNESSVVYLTLDALDVEADEMKLAEAADGENPLKDTFSALRLGLDPTRKYYAKVQAAGREYKASGWLGSSREQLLYADVNSNGDFIIKNARHLYNIRFLENENAGEVHFHSYIQEGRVDWAGETGILANGKAFQNGTMIKYDRKADEQAPEFPALKQLNQNSTYTAKKADSTDYALANMVFRTAGLENNEGVGLFCRNKGTITNVTFENAMVDGGEASYVGTLCGKNEGSLDSITVKKGTVHGNSYVGGIAGADTRDEAAAIADGKKEVYTGLKNSAEVWGSGANIGGVIGAVDWQAKDVPVAVKEVSNTGKVHGNGDAAGKGEEPGAAEEPANKNIGGIVGRAVNVKLEQCTSSQPFLEEDAEKYLVGTNVGGIAGEITNTSLEKCKTGGGYVYGGKNVGGIIGVVTADENGSYSGLDGKGGKNDADVLGNENVGGIVGRNEGTVLQWTNTGIVLAKKENAGGITGWNGENGEVTNCISKVNISSASGDELLKEIKAKGGSGNCIGGLVGYNNGTVEFDSKLLSNQVISVVAGDNYVGGIIGYNDLKGQLKGYSLGGGYAVGNCFVGGVCGVNLSYGLFRDEIKASPNRVEGNFYVGGIAGGNLIPISMEDIDYSIGSGNTATVHCSVNNFLGSVTANGAFGGGYIGYNFNLSMNNIDNQEQVRKFIADMTNIESGTVNNYTELQDPIGKDNGNDLILHIGTKSGQYAENVLGKVAGGLYIGGVVGFNSEKSGLTIDHVINETPVTATASIVDDTYGTGKTYSYAGGIIGHAGERVVISECRNEGSGSVKSKGSYTGGLTEVNLGKIESCQASSLAGTTEYVGGIAGINADTGSITGCRVTGNISGRSNVGGIVSENRGGSIKETVVSGTVRGTGENIGGVAAYQTAGGTGIEGAVVRGSVTGSGTNVGGIIGRNEGSVSNLRMEQGVSVSGMANVGGYIGSMSSGSLTGLTNTARVTAQAGNAGGIVGEMSGSYTISDCHNRGNVLADRAGNAGGITAVNSAEGTIKGCTEEGSDESNTGIVTANKGSMGGIAAANAGRIENCTVQGKSKDRTLSFTANQYAGGMAAVNSGTISGGTAAYININNQSVSRESAIGAVTGRSRGIIENMVVTRAQVNAYADGTSAGGVAGISEKADGAKAGTEAVIRNVTVDANVGFAGASGGSLKGNLGGMVGINKSGSRINDSAFTGKVAGNSGASYGYGGIAGINQSDITGCTVSARTAAGGGDDTLLQITGTAGDIPNAGGVAGKNEDSGRIDDVTIVQGKLTASGYAYLGGAAGYNDGEISNCDNDTDAAVNITGQHGHVGGMIGYNGAAGGLNDCVTGKQWTVEKTQHGTDEAIGGMIGYNTSGKDLTDLHNQAEVKHSASGSNSAGGIMGRQEVQASASWVLRNCRNDGDVTGKERVGGIIGQWKYNGGTLEKCENYAKITSTTRVAGIVGMLYSITNNSKLYFNQCYNEGTITLESKSGDDDNCAGILGNVNAIDTTVMVYFNECINAGNLSLKVSGQESGGIAARMANGTFHFTRCRNYGKLESQKGSMSGIVVATKSNPVLKQCVGIDTVKYPLTNQDITTDRTKNYYIARNMTSGSGKGQRLIANRNTDGTYKAENTELKIKIDNLEIAPSTYASRLPADICKDVEKNLPAFYAALAANEKLADPDRNALELNEQGGEYVFTWAENSKARYMDIRVNIYNEETDREPVYIKELTAYQGNSVRFHAEDEWRGKYMNISIQAVSDKEGCSSNVVWWADTPQEVGTLFASPKVYLQLTDRKTLTDDQIYQIVLENPEDYKSYDSVEVEVRLNNDQQSGVMKFNPGTNTVEKEGYVKGIEASSGKVITMMITATGKIEKENKTVTSRLQSYQTNVHPFDTNGSKITAKGSDCGFKGATEDMLTYQQQLTTSVGGLYARTEIMAYDANVGMEVAVNSIVSEISESGSTLVRLTDLAPEVKANVIKKPTGLTVRSYPWQSKNRLARYGKTVAEGLTAEQVQAYTTVGAGNVKSVKAGYIIERQADNRYTVLYSPLLNEKNKYTDQTLTAQVATLKYIEKPEIGEMQKNGAKLTFQWDERLSAADAGYNVTLTGYKKRADGSEEAVQLAVETDLKKKTLETDSSGWRYNRLELRVSRIGTVNNYNWTQNLGLSSTRSFDIKLPLESIAVPACEVIDKDELYYRVNWAGIQDPVERSELKGYTVWGIVDGKTVKLGEIADTGEDTLQTEVDLDSYEGKTMQIYIVANVIEGAVMYSDSEAGAHREVKVPNRLPAPELTGLTLADSYQADQYVTMDQYMAQGLDVSLGEGNTAGTYMIDAAIYDSDAANGENGAPAGNLVRALTDTRGQVMEVKDGKPAFTVRPETKEDAAEYAAKYLFVRFKTTDSSQISSKWTGYTCLRLPRVRLETVGVSAETMENQWQMADMESLYTTNPTVVWSEAAGETKTAGYSLKIKTAQDNASLNAGSDYDVRLLRTSNSSSGPVFQAEIPNLKRQNDDEPKRLYVPLARDEEYVSDDYDLYTADLTDLSWTLNGQYDTGAAYSADVCMKVQALVSKSTGDIIYRLSLPDTEEREASAEVLAYTESRKFIEQMYVQAVPADEQTFETSKRMKWYRKTYNQGGELMDVIQLEEIEDDAQ